MEPDVEPPEAGDALALVGQRIAARLTDWVLLFAIWIVLGGATAEEIDGQLRNPRWAILVWIAAVIVYEAALVAWRGQTLGKMLAKIAIVRVDTGETPSLGRSLARVAPVGLAMSVLGFLFPIVMVFVYFSAAFMPDNRGILDLAGGTVVVKRPG